MSDTPSNVSHRPRRTLVAGACAILAILTIGRGGPALAHWRAERLNDATEVLAEWERATTDIGTYAAVRRATRARQLDLGQAFPSLLHGGTSAAASGSLMQFVGDAADDAGVRLGAIDVRPDTTGRGVYMRVAASTEASGDIHGVAQFLSDVEGSELRIRIRELRITQPEPFASAAHPEALHLSIVVEGLARRPAAAKPLSVVSAAMPASTAR